MLLSAKIPQFPQPFNYAGSAYAGRAAIAFKSDKILKKVHFSLAIGF
jgi:hypothetical protein